MEKDKRIEDTTYYLLSFVLMNSQEIYFAKTKDKNIKRGDYVIVDDNGVEAMGRVLSRKKNKTEDFSGETKNIIRKVKPADSDIDKESIFEHIIDNIKEDGTLPDDFTLTEYKDKNDERVLLPDGCEELGPDYEYDSELFEFLTNNLKSVDIQDDKTIVMYMCIISKYFMDNLSKRISSVKSELLQDMIDNDDEYNPTCMYSLGYSLIISSFSVEGVKLGLILLALFDYDLKRDKELIDKLMSLALCEEFTSYVEFILCSIKNSNNIRFELLKKLGGYGKIYMLSSINMTPQIEEWIASHVFDRITIDEKILAPYIMVQIDFCKYLVPSKINENRVSTISKAIYYLTNEASEIDLLDDIFDGNKAKLKKLYRSFMNIDEKYKCNIDYLIANENFYNYMLSTFNLEDDDETHEDIFDYDYIIKYIEKVLDKGDIDECNKLCMILNQIEDERYNDKIYELYIKSGYDLNQATELLLCDWKYYKKAKAYISSLKGVKKTKDREKYVEDLRKLALFLPALIDYPLVGTDIVIFALKTDNPIVRFMAILNVAGWAKIIGMENFPKKLTNLLEKMKTQEESQDIIEVLNDILGIKQMKLNIPSKEEKVKPKKYFSTKGGRMITYFGQEYSSKIKRVSREYTKIHSLDDLFRTLLKSWTNKTAQLYAFLRWNKNFPAQGQSEVTACLVYDLFGGKICRIITNVEGEHYFNIIDDHCIDLTSDIFDSNGCLVDYEEYTEVDRCYFDNSEKIAQRLNFLKESIKMKK